MEPIFKGLSFYCLFQSVLLTGLFEPYEKMEKSRDATFRLLHNLPVPLWQSDEEGTRFFWNRAWISLLGYPSEEAGKPSKGDLSWEERIHPEDLPRYLRSYEKAVQEKKDFSLSYRIRDNRGQWRTLVDTAVPLLEEKGESGFWGISYDLTSLREALEQVKAKERDWRSLAKSLPDGLFRVSVEGRLLFVNSHGLEMFGVSRPILVLGKLLRETSLPAPFRALEEEYFQPYFQKIRELPEEPLSLRHRGRYYEVRIVPEEREHQEPSGVLCIVQDVTSRYLGQYEREKLLQRMHRFSIILENTSDLVCIITSRGEIEYINSSGIRLLGWQAHWLPRRLEDLYPGSEVESLLQESVSLLEGMFIRPRERILRTMDGEDLPVSQVMVPIHMEGESPRFGILARNIREQRRFEKELEYQKGLLQRLVDSIPMGVFLKDPSQGFRYIFWNSRMEEITGIPKEKVLGETDLEHFQPQVAEHLREQDESVVESGKPLIREEVRLFKEGAEHLVRLIKLPLLHFGESQEMPLLLGVLEDITEAKAVEAQLFQSQKMEAVGRLAGGIAHDLNNMLQIIHGYAELLMQNPPEEREKIEFFGSSIYNGCERAREFIEQLLVFHRKGTYRLERVSLNDLVGDMTDMLQHVMPEEVSLEFSPGEDLPDILADPGQIRQVVMNLCVNARDVLGERGEIRVSTKLLEKGSPPGKLSPENSERPWVVLSVQDNGPGMSREVREKIFEPFYSTKERGKGNGLGLSIVYAVAMRHKGYVDVESEPGGGSVFHVFLPLGEEAELVVREKAPPSRGSGILPGALPAKGKSPGGTLLFAEDDEVVRNFSREMLLSWGYRVIVAKNGREAVDLFGLLHHRIDALLFDVMMPEMSGVDAYKAIVAGESSPPVLFCTAFMDTGLPEDLKDRERVLFLKKPFSVEDLRQKVEELLGMCGT
jgi:PAS domain S-box-containing protein